MTVKAREASGYAARFDLKEVSAFLLTAAFFGSSFAWIKVATRELPAFHIASGRLVFGLASIALLMLYMRPELPKSGWMYAKLAFLGITNNAIPFFLVSWGEKTIDSSMAAVLESTLPMMTAVLAHFFVRGERLTRRRILGVSLGFVGVLALIGQGLSLGGRGSGGLLGQVALLGAAFSIAVSSIFTERFVTGVTPLAKTFFSMIGALVGTSAGALAFERPLQWPPSALTWIAIAALGVLCSGIAMVLYFWLLATWGPSRAMLVMYAMLVFGVGFGVLLLGEAMTWNLAAGAALIALGIVAFGR